MSKSEKGEDYDQLGERNYASSNAKTSVEFHDWRNARRGSEIHRVGYYADEPLILKTDDGAWLCSISTGDRPEGMPGQHSVARRSTDRGRSWSDPVDIEPASGPEGSKTSLVKVPSGRIYAFYTHNTDNLREVIADDPPYKGGKCRCVDSLGYFVFKYSDDHGRSWSEKRYPINVREMEIDRKNPYKGKVRFFWNSARSFIYDGAVYVPLTKVGGMGKGVFKSSEGVLLKSENIMTEKDPENITWQTLPDGDKGLRAPEGGGPIAEEHSYVVLSDGSFYCVYRTIDGYPTCTYSRDGGHSWTKPQYQRYADGHLMKHPRAANFAWRCSNGKYLYWFHNHGGHFIRESAAYNGRYPYQNRNPVWLCGGIEGDTLEGKIIKWSQPEVALYDDDTFIRMSYPDLIEEQGKVFLTESNKHVARVHEIDSTLLEGLWNQFENSTVTTDGLILHLPDGFAHKEIEMPRLPEFITRDYDRKDYGTKDLRQGFSVDLWICLNSLEAGQVILDSRTESGKGLCIKTTRCSTLEVVMNDGRTENHWDCDPGMLTRNKLHHVAVIVDGGPKIIIFVVDGKVCDGGEFRQFGWGHFSPNLRDVNGAKTARIGQGLKGEVRTLRFYGRYLRTSEVIGNYRAGLQGRN